MYQKDEEENVYQKGKGKEVVVDNYYFYKHTKEDFLFFGTLNILSALDFNNEKRKKKKKKKIRYT